MISGALFSTPKTDGPRREGEEMDADKKALLDAVIAAVKGCSADDYSESDYWQNGYEVGVSDALEAIKEAFGA